MAVATLAALLCLGAPAKGGDLDVLGDDLLSLVPAMGEADHPDALAVLELLGEHHPDVVVARGRPQDRHEDPVALEAARKLG